MKKAKHTTRCAQTETKIFETFNSTFLLQVTLAKAFSEHVRREIVEEQIDRMRDEERNNREIVQRLPHLSYVFVVRVVLNHDRRDAIGQCTQNETDRHRQ